MTRALVGLAAVFLAVHLTLLPPTLEDIDSINFALGVRDFDVARHQPHPPGYPIFIAAGKLSTAVFRAIGVPSPESRGLAVWSALSGTALIFLLFAFYRALDRGTLNRDTQPGQPRLSVPLHGWATLIAVASPLFWFTALRPLSDTSGLALAVAAQALLAAVAFGHGGTRALMAGAFVAGLAIGVRSQTFALTLPLLAVVLVMPGLSLRLADRIAAGGAASIGVLAWAVPLMVATGGVSAYAEALGAQAGEDFSGVVMLWTARTARVAADAVIYTFLWPWGTPATGAIVTAAAVVGAARIGWRAPRVLLMIAVAFGPYAVFHLLFHEFVTVRYALPLVVPVAYLAAAALDGRRRLLPLAAVGLATVMLVLSAVPSWTFGRGGSPTFRLIEDLRRDVASGADVARKMPIGVIGLHAETRRALQWQPLPYPVLAAPHGREWLPLVDAWRKNPGLSLAFVADPRRTDLALFDPRARQLSGSYRWGFVERPFVGGARPGNSDLYWMAPPGWMLERGWALTTEVAGITARDGGGPHVRPSVAWIRARPEPAELVIGGRHLGTASDPAATITATFPGRSLGSWTTPAGFFVIRVPLPAGDLHTDAGAYLPLEVAARPASGDRPVRVALEQFDVQSVGVPMLAYDTGWQEPEFNPATAISWRWMTERAALWVRPIGRDVALTLSGESPLRYYGRTPVVRVSIGEREVARFEPAADFTQSIDLSGDALAAADGRVTIESDEFFVPAERDGSSLDRRHLALRMYRVEVR